MGGTEAGTAVKTAWIDVVSRIVSFTALENAEEYRAEENAFWKRILLLMRQGYQVQ